MSNCYNSELPIGPPGPTGPQGPPGEVPEGLYIPTTGTDPSYPVTGDIEFQEIVDGTAGEFSIFRKEAYLLNQTGSLVFDSLGRVIMRSKYTDPSSNVYRSEIKVFGGNNTTSGFSLFTWNSSNQFNSIASSASQNYIIINSTIPNFQGLVYDDDYSADYVSDSLIARKDAPSIESGSGAPSSTPSKIGDLYIDVSTPQLYYSKGSTSSADWIAV